MTKIEKKQNKTKPKAFIFLGVKCVCSFFGGKKEHFLGNILSKAAE